MKKGIYFLFVVVIMFSISGCDKIKKKIKDRVRPSIRVEVEKELREEMMKEQSCGNKVFQSKWKGENDSVVQENGLIAEYLFNGNADDSSGNPNHGTVIGPRLAKDRFGKENSAYVFNGTRTNEIDDIIIVKSDQIFNVSALTISVWLNGNKPSGYARIIDLLRYGQKEGYNLIYHEKQGGVLSFQFFDISGRECVAVRTTSKLKDNEWQHIAVTYDGSVANIYYNGKLEDTNLNVSREIKPAYRYLSFGNGCDDSIYWPFRGMMDDIRLYNRALTEDEIKALSEKK